LAMVSAILAISSILVQYYILSRWKNLYPAGLLMGGVFYVIFIAVVLGIYI